MLKSQTKEAKKQEKKTKPKKPITIFETFAGIGSQLQALKNLAKKHHLEIISLGAVEWYIDAIISYQIIHHGISKIEMVNILNQHTLSADSKKSVSTNYFSKKSELWLRQAFPYLNSFLNRVKVPLLERERD